MVISRTGSKDMTTSLTNAVSNDQMTNERKDHRPILLSKLSCISSTRLMVLLILCLQNSMFTVLRRYSQGVLKENYSKYELLLVGEVIKLLFSAWMIRGELDEGEILHNRLTYLVTSGRKMLVLALIYGAMNILSFISLRNIGAGLFTIIAQLKILTTASFSAMILGHKYSWTKWRALLSLMFGVLLFSEPTWNKSNNILSQNENASAFIGTVAVLIEVLLSGFASIYFEKVIKIDPQKMTIWERNFQLALGSVPVYCAFLLADSPTDGFGSGWSMLAFIIACLGAAGGLLVALSIKYGDSVLKTLATTGAICLSSVLDAAFLGGSLTPIMIIAGVQVVVSICNYTFDQSIEITSSTSSSSSVPTKTSKSRDPPDEEIALIERKD